MIRSSSSNYGQVVPFASGNRDHIDQSRWHAALSKEIVAPGDHSAIALERQVVAEASGNRDHIGQSRWHARLS